MAESGLIGALRVGVIVDTKRATKNLKQFGTQLKGMRGVVARAGKSIGVVTAGLAAVSYAGKRAFNELEAIAQSLDSVIKTSTKLGIVTDELIGLHHGAELVGISTNTMDMALQRMVRRVSEAGKGLGESQDAIKELGLNAKELARLDAVDQLRAFAEAFQQIGSASERVRLAFKIFDSEGVVMLNILKDGKEGIDAYIESADKLGLTIGKSAEKVEKFTENMTKLRKVWEGFKLNVALPAISAITTAAEVGSRSKLTKLDYALLVNPATAPLVLDKMARAAGPDQAILRREAEHYDLIARSEKQVAIIEKGFRETLRKYSNMIITRQLRNRIWTPFIQANAALAANTPEPIRRMILALGGDSPFDQANRREFRTISASIRPANRLIAANTKEGYAALRANFRKSPERKELIRIGNTQVRKLEEIRQENEEQSALLSQINVAEVGP